ncbi:alpha/beta hydrolase [Amycolatopsis viridis]|uniref:Pimeloyl-ACP methyl ester carboxylesterase n=1 Tax=Amycolatopsis viridis TaxID=185678 RepID=A0ABX0ST73_9PSEU|nr:alpha/beta hydrolase [Amycolatopsis viridis]NIH79753.1 pimeloyl-ACP methyl ester carboxylesterase [Amycolatopsis viridis]
MVVLLACGLLAVTAPVHAEDLADQAPTPSLAWAGCGDGFQCATAQVPLDYQHPRGRTIDLALIKLAAADPARRIGTLFVNFGGPGPSGVERLRLRAKWPWLFSDELRARFDLVAWDSRGVGASTAVHCFATKREQQDFFAAFPAMPGDPTGEPAFYSASRDLADRCQAQAGDLLPHTSSVDTARDLDLLRRAVGDAKLTYHGISYGTHIGAIYANLFPNRVRALAMDGSMDFQGSAGGHGDAGRTLPVDTRQDVATGIAETFEQFLGRCAAAGPRCAFSSGDVHAKWATLAERVRREPVTITVDGQQVTYDYSALISAASDLSKPEDWPALARTLQQLYDTPGSAFRARSDTYSNNSTEAFNAIQCADSVVPRNEAVYSRLAVSEDKRVPYFGRIGVFDMMSCAYWPQSAVRPYTGPWNRPTANPILVINSRFDPATPLAGAIDGLHELADARLLVVEGAGHSTMYVHSTCAEKVKREYLIAGTLPAPGATCGIDGGPFG